MICHDFTFPTPAENLAADEALLQLAESGVSGEALRFWQPTSVFVVVGYANRIASEVNVAYCRTMEIPILRRCTGGGTVLQAPGVLNYSLILSLETEPFTSVAETNQAILERHRDALNRVLGSARVEWEGQTDLAIGGLKFSGNAQRRGRRYLLFHGSFLLELDFQLVEKTLLLPARQPCYRRHRAHSDFLLNLDLPASHLKEAMRECWSARQPGSRIPDETINILVHKKYGLEDWNARF